jgi:predicted hydrocarbon binding protein
MNSIATGAQLVRLPAGFLAAVHRVLTQGRSAVESATLLRQAGYETGEAFHAAFEEWLSSEHGGRPADSLSPEEFWGAFVSFWQSLGWGTVRHEQLHPGVGALECEDWAEAAAGETGHPSCHFTTGVLADLLSRIAGSDVAVLEVECRSAGSGRCRFLYGGVQAMEGVYRGMTEGLSYADAMGRLG